MSWADDYLPDEYDPANKSPQTVREQLAEALERALSTTKEIERSSHHRHFNPGTLKKMANALDRHRAEPEEEHCRDCGSPECPGYQLGLEAQRESVGGGTA